MVLSLVHACYIYIVCIHVDVPVYPLMKALGVIPLIAETKYFPTLGFYYRSLARFGYRLSLVHYWVL